MSIPQNPLDNSPSSSYKHVLVAFKYAEDAFRLDRDNSSKIDPTTFEPGDTLPNLGQNVVVVNEFTDQRFSINEAVWDFNFIPEFGVTTSSSVGKIVVDDRFIPYEFINFLRSDVLSSFNGVASDDIMALSHATFALKTFFISSQNAADVTDLIQVNPYFFNVYSIESLPRTGSISPTSHVMKIVGVVNSLAASRSISSVYQMNITHKDGNLHKQIPQTVDDIGLATRQQENSNYRSLRKQRLDGSKPMITLKDVFEGLQADLNQQKFVHDGQLQRWLREIRNDHVDKIIVAPKQRKGPTPQELPIDFRVDLDPLYYEYNVDNRNMPFEQPDVRQQNVGIRTFPIRTGNDLIEVVEKLMMLSKQVGVDAHLDPPRTYKTTITAERTVSNRYVVNIKVRRYILPHSHQDEEENTGPDRNLDPLHFFINDPEERDVDVISFKSDINFRVGDTMLERGVEDNVSAGIVYGDREQATAERRPDLSYFETMYSGIRPMIGSYIIDGLESAERAGNILNLLDPYTYTQTTEYDLVIRGNPLLLSDLNRNPRNVIDDLDGPVNYYPRPEVNPMYVKLTIFLKSQSLVDDSRIPERFYFDSYQHMYRVVNMFGQIRGSRSFYQGLMLRRTDDTI